MTFARVLVATDFSDHSMEAARVAARLAPGAAFRLVHVLRPFLPQPVALRTDATILESAVKRIEEESAREITAFARDVPLPSAETRVAAGSIGATIAREAADFRADLLVLGARGKSRAERLLLGSAAQSILRSCTESVLVVRGKAPPAGAPALRRIVVATDFHDAARAAADRAASLAREHGAEVVLHHALDLGVFGSAMDVPEDRTRGYGRVDRAWLERTIRELLSELNRSAFGGSAREVVTEGRAADEVAGLVAREKADLLVIGTHGPHPIERALLGSTASHLVEASPASVLVARG